MPTPPKLEFNEGAISAPILSVTPASNANTPPSIIPQATIDERAHFLPAIKANFHSFYETEKTITWLQAAKPKSTPLFKIALQLPDYLLPDSPQLIIHIKTSFPNDSLVYILGDTTYGSCCVDQVAADHLSSDAIVHYGRSCLTRNTRIPTFNVFGRLPIDVEDCVKQIIGLGLEQQQQQQQKLLVLYDVFYEHAIGELEERLKNDCDFVSVVAGMVTKSFENSTYDSEKANRGCCEGEGGEDYEVEREVEVEVEVEVERVSSVSAKVSHENIIGGERETTSHNYIRLAAHSLPLVSLGAHRPHHRKHTPRIIT